MGSQRIGHDWAILYPYCYYIFPLSPANCLFYLAWKTKRSCGWAFLKLIQLELRVIFKKNKSLLKNIPRGTSYRQLRARLALC